MESNINLLPDKDKQLKREVKAPKDVVEMSTPQDRIFQERVDRIGGVVEFITNLFKRKPTALPKTKAATPAPDPAVQFPAPKPTIASGPVTKVQTMPERLAPPPAPPQAKGFFSKIFGQAKTTASAAPVKKSSVPQPVVPVPPPPVPPMPKPDAPAMAAPVTPLPPVPPPPARRPAWAPPSPVGIPAAPVPAWSTKSAQVAPPPPPPSTLPPTAQVGKTQNRLSEAAPILGAGLNVNLVPQEYQPEGPSRNRLYAAMSIGIAVLLIAGTTIGLGIYERSLDAKIANLDTEIAALGQQVSVLESGPLQQASVLRQRTTDITKALDQHVYWDQFFEKIESVTLPTVSYGNMSVDVAGSVSMSATATTFDEVGKQLLTYQKATDFILQATILSATKVTSAPTTDVPPGQTATPKSQVTFSVSLRVNPKVFYHSR